MNKILNNNSTKLKLILALIHNNNEERCLHIKPNLVKLKTNLVTYYNVEIIESAYQPEITTQKTSVIAMRKILLWKINREWIAYKMMKPRNLFFDTLILFGRICITLLNKNQENKRLVIDSFVTNKHINAWNNFLEKKGDILVCFEDDAVFSDNSIDKLVNIVRHIDVDMGRPLYADFAGGCDFNILKVDNLISKKVKSKIFFHKPVTNTACSYMINDLTAKLFQAEIIKHPTLRYIPIDWLMNKLFILTHTSNKYLCFHALPHILRHGSNDGSYQSWLN